MTASIRPYQPRDLDALYDVCVRTAAQGHDASAALGDPTLPGHLYAGPYGVLEPQLTFVAEDADGVGGYVVGTDDTAAFQTRLETEWYPPLRARYPAGSGRSQLDNHFISLLHHPAPHDPDILAEYPAHLHINLLPRLQRLGVGTRLIGRFCDQVQRRGAAGVHVGVNPSNHHALRFYARCGFEDVRPDNSSVVLGLRLAETLGCASGET